MLSSFFAGIGTAQLTFLCIAAAVAGLARGFSGFGAALIFVPIASSAIGPKLAIPVLLAIDVVTTLPLIPNAWRMADRRDVAMMSCGALIGVPAGAYALSHADPLAVRWAIALLVVALLGLIVSGWRYRGRPAPPLSAAVGVVAGFCSGAAQVGGPPVVAYWLGGLVAFTVVRANIVLYFAVSSVFSVVSYLAGGLISADVLKLSLLVGPLYGLGLWCGSRLFGRADETVFRRICYALIAIAAIVGLPLWDALRA